MDRISHCNDAIVTHPCTIVIFGASGDLTSRKLMPALYRLFRKGFLPDSFAIVGCSRTPYSDEGFREHVAATCCRGDKGGDWEEFSAKLHYQPVDYHELDSFVSLKERLHVLRQQYGLPENLLYDLAVPPQLYPVIAESLGMAEMAGGEKDDGWVRMVVEKPFGRDVDSARELEVTLHKHFSEDQIFRIDHYLAKETVQNILSFRFANQIFEPLWNRNHIEWVGILSSEELGVENRAGYYDTSGVLRDMFQNHMMQLLSLVAIEPPSRFTADSIRDEKVKIFKSILPFSGYDEDIVLGQYEAGSVGGIAYRGYREESGVNETSRTPTFAMLKLDLDNWRWQGVPFYLVSGKRMQAKKTRVVIQFKEAPLSMFKGVVGEHVSGNRLVLSIYPEESIRLSIQAKIPGARICLRTGELAFHYTETESEAVLDAYEKVLLDCLLGDHMLFWRRDGIAATWKLLTPILEDCEGEECKIQSLHGYQAGSWGPKESLSIVREIIR